MQKPKTLRGACRSPQDSKRDCTTISREARSQCQHSIILCTFGTRLTRTYEQPTRLRLAKLRSPRPARNVVQVPDRIWRRGRIPASRLSSARGGFWKRATVQVEEPVRGGPSGVQGCFASNMLKLVPVGRAPCFSVSLLLLRISCPCFSLLFLAVVEL